MITNRLLLVFFFSFIIGQPLMANNYYIHPQLGDDSHSGLSKELAFKSLSKLSEVTLLPGDSILLANGEWYKNGIELVHQSGDKERPIVITSINWNTSQDLLPATINFIGKPYGILLKNCSYIEISNITLTANGFFNADTNQSMRCGIMVTKDASKPSKAITIKGVKIHDIYYENSGFTRGKNEVKTANGTQKYGWGIRVTNPTNAPISDIKIIDCQIIDVSHTGIKLTGNSKSITNVTISNNFIERTGGPGIQMSEVENVYVSNNTVTHSGSPDDSRKWGRGSGLWTWGSSQVLIEKNKFLYANGPGDSAGAHIDFNCDNVVLQYNLSAYNAGGFCEILGNNYNCAYRYNISINDGHRVKGKNGAFQEGKIFWLSGFQGEQKKRKGPVNTYFYNNTIYSDSTIVAKIAVDNTSNGILIANNIFYIKGTSQAVLGDQYKPDKASGDLAKHVVFKNNLFLNKSSWPKDLGIKDNAPIFGNPEFTNDGGLNAVDYTPENLRLILNKGIKISLLPNDSMGIVPSLKLSKDFLGKPIKGLPSIGAIEPPKPTKQ